MAPLCGMLVLCALGEAGDAEFSAAVVNNREGAVEALCKFGIRHRPKESVILGRPVNELAVIDIEVTASFSD